MSHTALKRDGHYTWDEYRTWPKEEQWELISGVAYDMSPAPSVRHQIIAGTLYAGLLAHFAGKTCRPLISAVDVKLSEEDVVQPDVLVVCEEQKIKPSHIEGAPTLVVEILSPSTGIKDRTAKMALYARAGVKEVWIVTPYPSLIEVYNLTTEGYRFAKAYAKEDALKSVVFRDLELALEGVFVFPLEPGEIRGVKEGSARYVTQEVVQESES